MSAKYGHLTGRLTDRDELRRLLAEARSKLPWRMGQEESVDYGVIYGAPYEREGGGYLLIPEVAEPNYGVDAQLIVAAVNALPSLLDALDAMEGRALAAEALVLAEKQRAEALEEAEAARDRYGHAHKACHEQRDAAWAVIERVREMHTPAREWCGYHESTRCKCVTAYCDDCGFSWPCPTVQALDGGGSDE